jgi:hypothetical protein
MRNFYNRVSEAKAEWVDDARHTHLRGCPAISEAKTGFEATSRVKYNLSHEDL